MNTTICGIDDRLLYIVIVWALISAVTRAYEAYLLRQKLKGPS